MKTEEQMKEGMHIPTVLSSVKVGEGKYEVVFTEDFEKGFCITYDVFYGDQFIVLDDPEECEGGFKHTIEMLVVDGEEVKKPFKEEYVYPGMEYFAIGQLFTEVPENEPRFKI